MCDFWVPHSLPLVPSHYVQILYSPDRAYVCSAQIETSLLSKKEATINHIAPFQVEVKGVFLKD